MHHKRRRRKKGGVKGHCHLCSLATTDGRRNGRTLTVQEQAARVSEREQTDAQRILGPHGGTLEDFWLRRWSGDKLKNPRLAEAKRG